MTVTICDVGPRDGLQNQPVTLAPSVRAELVNMLAAAGVPRIEATSFVSERHVPQMAGAAEVVAGIDRRDGVSYAGLVLNERGYDRLVESGLGEVHVSFAATDEFNQRNAGMSVEEGVRTAERILARAANDGIRAACTIGVAFGCPFAGAVDSGYVEELAGRLARAGAAEVAVADTVGVGVPAQVRDLVGRLLPLGLPVGVHFHNTRNTGYVNACAALEAGATVFDASIGGIGGCPFAPRATGNIATEDLVYLFHGQGVETGIDLEGVIEIARWLESQLGRELEGQVYKAGTFGPLAR
ncbi:MAG TPA: hydroxymethylglutaryl-CoA lyase [Gaiella sp.]|nr:hydroxymethylglutaryl-CoA lyase [Gaiella sp.]